MKVVKTVFVSRIERGRRGGGRGLIISRYRNITLTQGPETAAPPIPNIAYTLGFFISGFPPRPKFRTNPKCTIFPSVTIIPSHLEGGVARREEARAVPWCHGGRASHPACQETRERERRLLLQPVMRYLPTACRETRYIDVCYYQEVTRDVCYYEQVMRYQRERRLSPPLSRSPLSTPHWAAAQGN